LWRLDTTIRYGLRLQAFANTLIGNIIFSRTSVDELSSQSRKLYKTTHNILKRQTPVFRWDSNPQS